MNTQAKRLVNDLQQKIQQKDGNNQLWYVKNQNDFFKCEALKLFEANKSLRLQVKLLKKTIKDYEVTFEANNLTLKKLKSRELKNKYSLRQNLQEQQFHPFTEKKQLKISKLRIRQRLQTQQSKKLAKGRSQRIVLHHPISSTKIPTSIGIDRYTYNPSVQSRSNHSKLDIPLQSKLQQCEEELSGFINIKLPKRNAQKMDRSTQTGFYFNQEGQDSSKKFNQLKNGFHINAPNKRRKQSMISGSFQIQGFEKEQTESILMNKVFSRNKLSNSQQNKSRQKRALFKQTK